MKRILLPILIVLGVLLVSCDRSRFTKLNQDPTNVTQPDLSFLFTQALYNGKNGMETTYTQWFYDNAEYILPWTQVASVATSSQLNLYGEAGDRISQWYSMMAPLAEIRHYVDDVYTGKKQVSYQRLKAITYPVQIYYGLRVTDVFGSEPYSQAMQAPYTNPPMLTPKYDSQDSLLTKWLDQLNNSLQVLETQQTYNGNDVNEINPQNEDFVYNGDWTQWAKFINSLKLRIAVRLLSQDKQKAMTIVQNVMKDQYGPIMQMNDNFNWAPDVNYDGPAQQYVTFPLGARNLIAFLRENKDPRLLDIFTKNDFNSMVIQGFFDAGKTSDIPKYIQKVVNDTTIKAGSMYQGKMVTQDSTIFTGWKSPGAPWVRYFGAPIAPDSSRAGNVADQYFTTTNWQLQSKQYEPVSTYNVNMFGTRQNITYPDIPSRTVTHQNTNAYFHDCLYSAAETNLYLAEFKLLGANLPNSAEQYFQTGIMQSIETYNWMAQNNNIPYYSTPYDTKYGASIESAYNAEKNNNFQQLLQQPAYTLTGNTQEDLQKVYIQEFVNFMRNPTQLYVTARRSGVPEMNSKFLAREPFYDGGQNLIIPRRFEVNNPTKDNVNYNNAIQAFKAEGFTAGSNDPQVLNQERVWYDKGAPHWGDGPNY